MLIGIDANEANVSQKVGSNIYAHHLINYFYQKARENPELHFRIYLKKNWQTLFPQRLPNWQYQIFGPQKAWTQFALPLRLYLEKLTHKAPDIFFTLGHYAPRFSPIPTVISIMDLAFLNFPEEFLKKDLQKLSRWTSYSAQKAQHIFTISQASKADIIKAYKIKPEKITVTYLGVDLEKPKLDSDRSFQLIARHLGIKKPYLIYLGTLQPRKNINRLIDSFIQVKNQTKFKDYQLVLVGKKGWLFDSTFQKVNDLGMRQEIIFTGFVSDFEKIELLRNAELFVLPSLYEGFGIPILEAMCLGIPVLASQVSSIPEVGGAAISYIKNPQHTEDITKSLTRMLKLNEDKKLEIIATQKKQAENFSWESCGQKTLEKLIELTNNIKK